MALPEFLRRPSLVTQIVIALLLGTLVGVAWPAAGRSVELLGTAFVEALKAVAPVLVLVGFLYVGVRQLMDFYGNKMGFSSERAIHDYFAALAIVLKCIESQSAQ